MVADDVLAANAAFYDAFERRSLMAMSAVWEHSERVVCVHPGWPILRSWGIVEESWRRIFAGPGRTQFILTNEVVTVHGDVAWVTLDENLVDGRRPRDPDERCAVVVRLDERGQELRVGVVERVRAGDADDVDVREHVEHVDATVVHQRVPLADDDECGHHEVGEPLERRVARHGAEQPQAAHDAEAQVVAGRDAHHRRRLAQAVERHLTQRPRQRHVVRAAGRRHQHGTGDAVRERGGDLDHDGAAERVGDERRSFDAHGVAIRDHGARQPG